MSSAVGYLLLALLGTPLWWPALRLVLRELDAAAASTPPGEERGTRAQAAPLVPRWSSPRARLAALPVRVARTGHARWEGGFGRRSP